MCFGAHILSIAYHNTAFRYLSRPHPDVGDAIRQPAPDHELHDERAHVIFFTGEFELVDRIGTMFGTTMGIKTRP